MLVVWKTGRLTRPSAVSNPPLINIKVRSALIPKLPRFNQNNVPLITGQFIDLVLPVCSCWGVQYFSEVITMGQQGQWTSTLHYSGGTTWGVGFWMDSIWIMIYFLGLLLFGRLPDGIAFWWAHQARATIKCSWISLVNGLNCVNFDWGYLSFES